MKLQVIGTGSSGNCYILTDNRGHMLMLEAGVKIDSVLKAIDYDMSRMDGIVITHEHGDHAMSAKLWAKRGQKLYASKGTLDAIGSDLFLKWMSHPVKHNELTCIGNYKVKGFNVVHDATEPFGYLISHTENKVLFITDTSNCNIVTKGVNTMMVECNFDFDDLQSSGIHESLKKRIYEAHFSLTGCKAFLAKQDLSQCRNIVIIHCSSERADTDRIKSEIEAQTGIPVTIAKNGLTINL